MEPGEGAKQQPVGAILATYPTSASGDGDTGRGQDPSPGTPQLCHSPRACHSLSDKPRGDAAVTSCPLGRLSVLPHPLAPLLVPSPDSSSWGFIEKKKKNNSKILRFEHSPFPPQVPTTSCGMRRMWGHEAEDQGPLSPVPVPSFYSSLTPSSKPGDAAAVGPGAGSRPALAFSLVLFIFFALR